MAAKTVAKSRQSQLVTTYGVGSLFPAADESFMVLGLDYWSDRAPHIEEPRLARALGVSHFRTPPAGHRSGDVPVTRFPLKHYCPKCHRLGSLLELADEGTLYCKRCGDTKVIPSRFVACCENGHIEDFPYWAWVHSGDEVDEPGSGHLMTLRVRGQSSSLSDIIIGCSCGVDSKALTGAFGSTALQTVTRCHARRPWLPTDDERCDQPLRALQRGSSNVWFASMRSSISIPPWSTAVYRFVERHWAFLEVMPTEQIADAIHAMVRSVPGVTVEGVNAVVARRKGILSQAAPTEAELRADEYTALVGGTGPGTAHDTFICEPTTVSDSLDSVLAQVSKVGRLREVRALQGFSRVTPQVPDELRGSAPLSEQVAEWLPAIEVHGEGVFIRLHESLIAEWERGAGAARRIKLINDAQYRRDLALNRPDSPPVSARFVALHSIAHMLLDEFSLHAGYPSASLRERIYAAPSQAGILLYTASSDSAGSLGGLAALAGEERFAEIFQSALDRAGWCSSDPVCAESRGSGSENLNLAACHACILLPETSCESRNIFLDRVCIVSSPEFPGAGLLA